MGRTACVDECVGSIRLNSGLRKPVTIESHRPWGLSGERYIRITATPIAKNEDHQMKVEKLALARTYQPAVRSANSISAMTVFGLALVPSSAVSQQKSLNEQLVGAWTLVSGDITAPDGTKRQPYGANPKGILILDAGGRYAWMAMRPDR